MSQNPKFLVKNEREVRRYDLRNLGSSLLDAFNFEFGVLFTLKSLLSRPGKSTLDYLSKGRLRYFSPFRLLLISTAILLIIVKSSDISSDFEEGLRLGMNETEAQLATDKEAKAQDLSLKIYTLFKDNFNILIWLYIPFVSFFSYLFNVKRRLNYAEHIVFNTYYTSVVNIFSLILLLGYQLYIEVFLSLLYMLLSIVYYAWFYKDLLGKSWGRSILDTILINLISIFFYSIGTGFLIGFAIAKNWVSIA